MRVLESACTSSDRVESAEWLSSRNVEASGENDLVTRVGSMHRLHQDFPGAAAFPEASRPLAEYLEPDEERLVQRNL